MQKRGFKDCFPKRHRPKVTDLEMFWPDEIYALFRKFAEHILEKYDLRFGIPLWTETYGWTYRVGKSGVYLIKGIQIRGTGFVVEGTEVTDRDTYVIALKLVEVCYEREKEAFLRKIAEKNAKQVERNKARVEREKEEISELRTCIVPEKYNLFCWPRKLDIQKLNKLYQVDAKGLRDEILADEIGLTLYMRCKYGKEDMIRMERNVIRCHGCSAELDGESDFRQCACGRQYSFKAYRRSFRKDNMPTGDAANVFSNYLQEWGRAKGYEEKIVLIDTLLHEFHLSLIAGTIHRPVAMNFIDGSRSRVEEIIKGLARK